ncbi:MAG: phosphate propanoyltransferase [Dehalobacterium sp.]
MQLDLNQEEIAREVVKIVLEKQKQFKPIMIPVGISNRHVHLAEADVEKLFGSGHKLHVSKKLSQPGYYAAEETVTLVGPKGAVTKVRVLGPPRPNTQVEILLSDRFILGIEEAPIRDSGTLGDCPCLTIVGPNGAITNCTAVFAAWRHIHMNSSQGKDLGIKDGDIFTVEINGDRSLVFNKVKVRLNENFITEIHLDIDEANAGNLKNGDLVRLVL